MNNRDIPIPSSQDAFVLVVYGNPPYAGRINISSGIKSFFFSLFSFRVITVYLRNRVIVGDDKQRELAEGKMKT